MQQSAPFVSIRARKNLKSPFPKSLVLKKNLSIFGNQSPGLGETGSGVRVKEIFSFFIFLFLSLELKDEEGTNELPVYEECNPKEHPKDNRQEKTTLHPLSL